MESKPKIVQITFHDDGTVEIDILNIRLRMRTFLMISTLLAALLAGATAGTNIGQLFDLASDVFNQL